MPWNSSERLTIKLDPELMVLAERFVKAIESENVTDKDRASIKSSIARLKKVVEKAKALASMTPETTSKGAKTS